MTHPDIPIDADKDTKHSSDDISTPIDKLENEAVLDSDETETEFLDDPPLFQFLTGIKQDLKARLPLYMDDWSRPKKISTVVNSIVFVFIVQLIPALIFAELMDRETEGNLATAEVLLSGGIMGIIYAFFAGQPLVVLGITGPVALLLGTSYGLTATFNAEYFPFFFWVCIWAGLMHIISAMVGLVSLVWKVTPFTTQIFELFIAFTFIYSALNDLISPIQISQDTDNADRGAQYASLVIGFITFYISWSLHFAELWVNFNRPIRTFLASYNTLVALVVGTALSYLPGVDQPNNGVGGMDRVSIRFYPWDWQPTADRQWIASPFQGIDTKGIFGAIIPGFMFFLLFIIDHNVSTILTNSPRFNLQKPPAYHLDFFVLGLIFIPCAVLGIPPGNGLIPQAPLHARSLCTREYFIDPQSRTHREVVTHCEEQRWSGLGQAAMMFVALSSFRILSWIPRGCLFGLFLYLGFSAIHGNEIWERVTMNLIVAKRRPQIPVVTEVNWRTVKLWTFIQVCCAVIIFAVGQFASFGYIYPALLTALVPFRSYVLYYFFDENDIVHLDPSGETEEEHLEEQREIFTNMLRRDSIDSEEAVHFPNRADFHPLGMKKEIHDQEKIHHMHEHEHPNGEIKDIVVDAHADKSNIDRAMGDSNAIELTEAGEYRENVHPANHNHVE